VRAGWAAGVSVFSWLQDLTFGALKMARWLFGLTETVKDGERALLSRDGRFVRVLGPGLHRLFDWAQHLSVETFKIAGSEIPYDRYATLADRDPQAAKENFTVAQTKGGEMAIVYFDGLPSQLLKPWMTRVFWRGVTKINVEIIDTGGDPRIAPELLQKLKGFPLESATQAVIEAHETGMLFINGQFVEQLKPGRHAFWLVDRTVRIQKLDLRPQALEITAQEILTKDRIGIRVTLTAFWRIKDPMRAVAESTDLGQTIYKITQFAIREAIAGRTLDDILSARDKLDAELRAFVTARTENLGVVIDDLGVKDVILPGEIRELINKVVEAERTAKANLIRRQEETAATRSLLNTAKLMEDNKLLLRLKELEALEKLVEKVGRIDLHATGQGQGLEAILTSLFRMEPGKAS
jgi:regulator of protease activity HflC (stomatin/prohibitin superfamily)